MVIVLVDIASHQPVEPGPLAADVVGGLALGAGIGTLGGMLLRAPWTEASEAYRPLGSVAVAVIVFAAAQLTGVNVFLAAFAAGPAVAGTREQDVPLSTDFDELIAEVLKLAALLVFGALLSPAFIANFSVGDALFVVAAIAVARPVALALALVGGVLSRREWMAAAWFGPKGFASVVYALLVLNAGLAGSERIFHLAGAVVALSIVLHSSTDVVVARSFEHSRAGGERGESPPDGP